MGQIPSRFCLGVAGLLTEHGTSASARAPDGRTSDSIYANGDALVADASRQRAIAA